MSNELFTIEEITAILHRAQSAVARGENGDQHHLLVRGACAEVLEARPVEPEAPAEPKQAKGLTLRCALDGKDEVIIDRGNRRFGAHANLRFRINGSPLVVLSEESERRLREYLGA